MRTLIVNQYLSKLWTPADLTIRPLFWFNASNISSLSLNENTVTAWKSIGSNTLSLSASGSLLYEPGGLNGIPCINWGDNLNSSGFSITNLASFNPTTVYFLGQLSPLLPDSSYHGLVTFNYSTNFDIIVYPSFGNTSSFINGSTTPVATYPVASPFVLRRDGVSSGRTSLYVGKDRGFSDRGLIGKIAEVIIPGYAPTSEEDALITTYLLDKINYV